MYKKLNYESLFQLCNQIFKTYGYTQIESNQITDILLKADLFGVESHGISRIMKYHNFIKTGAIKQDAVPEILHETKLSAVYDAKGAMGQLAGVTAMKKAIEKAKLHGIGMVQVKNSNHYGIAGYYALMAAQENLLGISMTNTVSIMVPTFSSQAMLGSNPIAFAMPAKPHPFLFDASTTVVTRGKIEVYHKQNKPLEPGWAVDEKGNECQDAGVLLENIKSKKGGGILPLGGFAEKTSGYKGYGFAMICEIMTSILSGGITSSHKTDFSDTSHCFYALDYEMFGSKEEINARLSEWMDEIRNAKKAEGQERIYIAGEKEWESSIQNKKQGIRVNEKTYEELRAIIEEQGIECELSDLFSI